MKQSFKIMSIVTVVLGALAILGSLVTPDVYGLLGGALFLTEGWLALVYIGQQDKVERRAVDISNWALEYKMKLDDKETK